MAIVTGITTLDMSGTTEVSGISFSAGAQGTLAHKIRIDLTGASTDAVAKVYENYVLNSSHTKTVTGGTMVDLDRAIGLLESTVVKLTPAGGGGTAVAITVKAVTEDIATRTLDSDFNATQKASIVTAADSAITANDTVELILSNQGPY